MFLEVVILEVVIKYIIFMSLPPINESFNFVLLFIKNPKLTNLEIFLNFLSHELRTLSVTHYQEHLFKISEDSSSCLIGLNQKYIVLN